MPLLKRASKKAWRHNFKAELRAGRSVQQALAIAYSIQREGKKNMAKRKRRKARKVTKRKKRKLTAVDRAYRADKRKLIKKHYGKKK